MPRKEIRKWADCLLRIKSWEHSETRLLSKSKSFKLRTSLSVRQFTLNNNAYKWSTIHNHTRFNRTVLRTRLISVLKMKGCLYKLSSYKRKTKTSTIWLSNSSLIYKIRMTCLHKNNVIRLGSKTSLKSTWTMSLN